MGFATVTGRTKNVEMLLATILEKPDPEAAKASAKAGAGLLMLADGDLEKGAAKIKVITSAVEIPCGMSLKERFEGAGNRARSAGLDFLVLQDDSAPASLLLDEEIGYVMTIEDDQSDTSLRLLESASFDALAGSAIEHGFTIKQQLELRRISGLARKPLILKASDGLTSEELECLRDTGVAALLLEGPDAVERLAALKPIVDAMRPRRRRKDRDAASPTLPSMGHGGEDDEEEE
jgi:hypothetical protein